jgi:hypothetical protein
MTETWNIKDAFRNLLADYIRNIDGVDDVLRVDKIEEDDQREDDCSEGCCGWWVNYTYIYYTTRDGRELVLTFRGKLRELLEI